MLGGTNCRQWNEFGSEPHCLLSGLLWWNTRQYHITTMKETGDQQSEFPRQGSAKVKPPTYQPSAQEMNEEFDMPGAIVETVRRAFFKPLDLGRKHQATEKAGTT